MLPSSIEFDCAVHFHRLCSKLQGGKPGLLFACGHSLNEVPLQSQDSSSSVASCNSNTKRVLFSNYRITTFPELELCSQLTPPLWVLVFLWFHRSDHSFLFWEGENRRKRIICPSFLYYVSLCPPLRATVTWPNKVSHEKGSWMTERERRGWGRPIFPPSIRCHPSFSLKSSNHFTHHSFPSWLNCLDLLHLHIPPSLSPSSSCVYFSLTQNTVRKKQRKGSETEMRKAAREWKNVKQRQ